MRITHRWILAIIAVWPAFAAAQTAPLNDQMTLPQIAQALKLYGPRWENGDGRAKIAASLDRHITVQVRKGMSEEDRQKILPVAEFYKQCVEQGLTKLEQTIVIQGVHVFKFYSSSYIFRSATGTIAVEFAQGPNDNGGEPEDNDPNHLGFYWSPQQRDRLANLVDAQIITHWHHDHADYSLAKRLIAQGKPVIGPAQLETKWKDLAGKITVPDFGKIQRIGPLEIYATLGWQYSTNHSNGNGSDRDGAPNKEHPERDSQTIAFLFKLAGITFITAGENHVPAQDWLRQGVTLGFKPNVRLSTGQYQGDRAITEVLKTLKPVFRLPLHDHEMTHPGGGNAVGSLWTSSRKAFDAHQMMPLFWGEDFLITDETVAFTR